MAFTPSKPGVQQSASAAEAKEPSASREVPPTVAPSRGISMGDIAQLPVPLFVLAAAIVLVGTLTNTVPSTLLGGLAITILLGGLLARIGSSVPFLKDFGLPTILCTFGPAILIYLGVMPGNAMTAVNNLVEGADLLNFLITAIIVGSVLGMSRQMLIQVGIRFLFPLVGCIATTFGLVGLLAAVTGYGFIEGLLFIAAPIMAGGAAIGAIPMADMYAQQVGGNSADFLGQLLSTVIIANVICIVLSGIISGISARRKEQLFVGFDGHGNLLRVKGKGSDLQVPKETSESKYRALAQGLILTATIYVLGVTLGHFVDFLHPLGWIVLAVLVIKLSGLMPRALEESASRWGDLVGALFVPTLLVTVSFVYVDIANVLNAMQDPLFLLLTVATVLIAALTSGVLGFMVKFYFVEATIVPGLILADTGSTGDISVLSAAKRLHLLPFATLTNRLGGALVLLVTSLVVPFLTSGAV